MKKILLVFLLAISTQVHSQVIYDSVKVSSSWYLRTMPVSLYTGSGVNADRITQNLEVGRAIGVLDIGLAYGRTSLRTDSTQYLEGKVTIDACQLGLFSNEYTVGFGHVFNSRTPIMLELSSTIFAQLGKHWGIGVVTGYYDFSGELYSTDKNYFGLFFRYGLLRNDGSFLGTARLRKHIKTLHK